LANEKLIGRGSHIYNTACDVVVLLGNKEKEELLKHYAETLKTELGNAKQASEAS
jgi:hypothetical protein